MGDIYLFCFAVRTPRTSCTLVLAFLIRRDADFRPEYFYSKVTFHLIDLTFEILTFSYYFKLPNVKRDHRIKRNKSDLIQNYPKFITFVT